MRLTLGYVLLVVWVIGFLATLAKNVWSFATQYHEDERVRARADRSFTIRLRPGPIGWIVHVLTLSLLVGLGLIIEAAMWPATWLLDWYADRRAADRPDDPEA